MDGLGSRGVSRGGYRWIAGDGLLSDVNVVLIPTTFHDGAHNLHPQSSILNPQPSTLNPQPCTRLHLPTLFATVPETRGANVVLLEKPQPKPKRDAVEQTPIAELGRAVEVRTCPPGYGAAVSADFSNHCHMGFMYVDRKSHTLFSGLLLSASFSCAVSLPCPYSNTLWLHNGREPGGSTIVLVSFANQRFGHRMDAIAHRHAVDRGAIGEMLAAEGELRLRLPLLPSAPTPYPIHISTTASLLPVPLPRQVQLSRAWLRLRQGYEPSLTSSPPPLPTRSTSRAPTSSPRMASCAHSASHPHPLKCLLRPTTLPPPRESSPASISPEMTSPSALSKSHTAGSRAVCGLWFSPAFTD